MESKPLLKGIGASAGVVEGVVYLVTDHRDAANFVEDSILVAPMTEPSMIMMMNRASAIVTDHGGITSHPAIVSRELGIPCVVATKEATAVLKSGMRVRVDGAQGVVYLLTE